MSPQASIQLIVFGERNRTDLAGVFHDVAAAGFPAVEAGNLFEAFGEDQTRRLLTENNLAVSGAHFGYGDYADPDRLGQNIAYAKAIGLKNLMCSGVADTKSAEGYRQSARVFDAAGKRLAEEGLAFNYHNHAWEFDDLGGTNGMRILSEETDPAFVKFNIDVFWVYYAGEDPSSFIKQHAERAGYFHFKDGKRLKNESGGVRPEFLELGRGDVDLPAAFQAAADAGATWIVYEQDNTRLTPLEAATISRGYLRTTLGV